MSTCDTMENNQNDIPNRLLTAPFTTKIAVQHGISKHVLKKWVDCGTVRKIGHGTYLAAEERLLLKTHFHAATLRIGTPSAICLTSALHYYKLALSEPGFTWMMVNANKRTKKEDFCLWRRRKPEWEIGINKHKGFWITSLERTLIESLAYKKYVRPSEAFYALQRAFMKDIVTYDNFKYMAERLKLTKRIEPYFELLNLSAHKMDDDEDDIENELA